MVETDRGSLPFSLVHGEPLVAAAAWAMGEAGVVLVDLGTGWEAIVESGSSFVLHDALCPLTPPGFLVACVTRAEESGAVVVGVRPVTDTVKRLSGDGTLGETVDRETLLQVTSPVVLPPGVVAELDGVPGLDFATLVTTLGERFEVETLEAPPQARRVADEAEVRVVEALSAANRPPARPRGT